MPGDPRLSPRIELETFEDTTTIEIEPQQLPYVKGRFFRYTFFLLLYAHLIRRSRQEEENRPACWVDIQRTEYCLSSWCICPITKNYCRIWYPFACFEPHGNGIESSQFSNWSKVHTLAVVEVPGVYNPPLFPGVPNRPALVNSKSDLAGNRTRNSINRKAACIMGHTGSWAVLLSVDSWFNQIIIFLYGFGFALYSTARDNLSIANSSQARKHHHNSIGIKSEKLK